jgi:hypothetical protein
MTSTLPGGSLLQTARDAARGRLLTLLDGQHRNPDPVGRPEFLTTA